jgi:ABC-type nitrate/sulfonate/bicarbonate transport system substrate-binding protein
LPSAWQAQFLRQPRKDDGVMLENRYMAGAGRGQTAMLLMLVCGVAAQADVAVRVGKAQAQNFAFLVADVGIAAGIFKKHGIDLEIANFGGDARLVQAISANAIDFALGGGPTIAFEVKGAPMLAVAAMADRPAPS